MGLFDFISETGKKLFGKEDDAADKIKQDIEADNPGVQDLGVNYQDGVVTLSGNADSAEAMEKAVLMAGNVQGVSEVRADNVQVPPAREEVEYYVIQSGDTLSALAKKYYGNAGDYPRIFEANQEVIKDADKIYPGQKIRIPLDTV
jgi:nucleoid-associated protein YgaU